MQRSRSGRRLAVERLEDRTMLSASALFPALLSARGLSGNYGPFPYGASPPALHASAPAASPSAAALGAAYWVTNPMVDSGSGGTMVQGGTIFTGGTSLLAAGVTTFQAGDLTLSAGTSSQVEGPGTGETGATTVSGGTVLITNEEGLAPGGTSLHVGADEGDFGSSLAVGDSVAFDGVNAYTGDTAVIGGTLIVANSESLAQGSNLTVSEGAPFGKLVLSQANGAASTATAIVAQTPSPSFFAMPAPAPTVK